MPRTVTASDVYVAPSDAVAGATAGTYPLVLKANGVKVRIQRIEISAASAGSVKINRAASSDVSGGAGVTEVNSNGTQDGTPTAVATKGTRTSDHTVANETLIRAHAMAANAPLFWLFGHREFVLDTDQCLVLEAVVAADDDSVYATVDWEEIP